MAVRWFGLVCLVAVICVGCGGAARLDPANANPASALEVQTAEPPNATPTEVQIPTPTPTPSSREAPLQPAASAPAPVLKGGTAAPEVNARAMIVVDEASGAVLWERNAGDRLPPASLTKIATAVVALEAGGLERRVDIDVDSKAMPSSTVMGLLPGDSFQLSDLLYGLMLPSGNDAALAIARAVSGSDAAFVRDMNALMVRMGLRDTHFSNPHGLGSSSHYTSAFDLAMLTRYAMSYPGFEPLSTTRSWVAKGSRNISMYNLNTLLGGYSGADGVKVGYTRSAGHTLVASASRNGHRVYVVLLNAPDKHNDAKKLLDWAFANHTWPPASR